MGTQQAKDTKMERTDRGENELEEQIDEFVYVLCKGLEDEGEK